MIVHDVQQNSPEWLQLRSGMPTASDFSKLVTNTGKASTQYKKLGPLLAAEKYTGGPIDQWAGNAATERGHEMEPRARAYYQFTTDRELTQVGFVTTDDMTAGCSPDSFVGEDGLLEIKCPLAAKHSENLDHIHREGTCPPDYYAQVQGQLMITGREWCDLLFFHPELPAALIRVMPDEGIQKELAEGIKKTIAERDRIYAALIDQDKEAA